MQCDDCGRYFLTELPRMRVEGVESYADTSPIPIHVLALDS